MSISLVVAMSENNVIGKKKELPWYLPADLKHFAKITKGHAVVMGRKTYESIIARLGKPLPERENIIITRQKDFDAPGCIVVTSWEEALSRVKNHGEVFVIGGAEIFKLSLPSADKLYLTLVHATIDGDVFFPEYNKSEWKEVSREQNKKDARNPYDYTFFEYVKS